MSTNSVDEFLLDCGRVALDTSVFIFQIEKNPKYLHLVNPIFQWLERPRSSAVSSTITMLEILVAPYRVADMERVNNFYALLSTYPHLEWVPPSLAIADCAARLRAEHNLKTPDAIQAATALSSQARGLISNDAAFRRLRGIKVLILDDLL